MDDDALRLFVERSSDSERFAIALRFQNAFSESFLATVPIREGATAEERARTQFEALRQAKRDGADEASAASDLFDWLQQSPWRI